MLEVVDLEGKPMWIHLDKRKIEFDLDEQFSPFSNDNIGTQIFDIVRFS